MKLQICLIKNTEEGDLLADVSDMVQTINQERLSDPEYQNERTIVVFELTSEEECKSMLQYCGIAKQARENGQQVYVVVMNRNDWHYSFHYNIIVNTFACIEGIKLIADVRAHTSQKMFVQIIRQEFDRLSSEKSTTPGAPTTSNAPIVQVWDRPVMATYTFRLRHDKTYELLLNGEPFYINYGCVYFGSDAEVSIKFGSEPELKHPYSKEIERRYSMPNNANTPHLIKAKLVSGKKQIIYLDDDPRMIFNGKTGVSITEEMAAAFFLQLTSKLRVTNTTIKVCRESDESSESG